MWSLEAVLPGLCLNPYHCVLGWRDLIWQYIAYSFWAGHSDKGDRRKSASSKEEKEHRQRYKRDSTH